MSTGNTTRTIRHLGDHDSLRAVAGFRAVSRYLTLKDNPRYLLLCLPGITARVSTSRPGRSVEADFPLLGEVLRFFDIYLMGIDTGLSDEPPIFLVRAKGRIERSTVLESRPWSRKRLKSCQRESALRMASGNFVFWLVRRNFFPQPWLHGLEDRLAPLPPLDPTGIGRGRGLRLRCGRADALESFAGDRRGSRLGKLAQAAPHMGPTQGQANPTDRSAVLAVARNPRVGAR